ncbi:hypothetical protein [Candidatus Reidiella endopervernicosa]|uniref:Uncharacterized protein n=1 Tax=Candidatus Reidiella endopervernicosa TaxID=2738883 RepID=A0A6N0HTW2_9GAMM|nr:hypothetical protein [Candidatus Reidiella endopervernicosa]QKQ25606.1 hypothetical protein HUE57_04315 [Candidatus Reidiella endopervernicosa]
MVGLAVVQHRFSEVVDRLSTRLGGNGCLYWLAALGLGVRSRAADEVTSRCAECGSDALLTFDLSRPLILGLITGGAGEAGEGECCDQGRVVETVFFMEILSGRY